MTFLARLGDFLALGAFGVGLWRLHALERSRRLLVAFLGVSGACGFGQWCLKTHGYQTAWFGNLADLAILVLLIPSALEVTRASYRASLKPLLMLFVVIWAVWNVALGWMPDYAYYIRMGFYGLMGLAGVALLSHFIDDSLDLIHKPEFLLALVMTTLGFTDLLLSLALSHYSALHMSFLIAFMTTRNALWCGAYLLLAYSLILDRRIRGELRDGLSVHEKARMEFTRDLHKRSGGPWRRYKLWHYAGRA